MKKSIFFFLIIMTAFISYSQQIDNLGVYGSYYDIKSDNSGTIHIIWIDNGWAKYGQIVNQQIVNEITIPGLLRNEVNARKFRPRMSVKPDGTGVHMVWVSPNAANSRQFMHVWKNSAGNWNKEVIYNSTSSGSYVQWPAIAADSTGVLHAACIEWKTTNYPVVYWRKAVGGSWVRQTNLTPTDAQYRWVTMFTDTSGNVHVVWDRQKALLQYRSTSPGGNLSSSSTLTLPAVWSRNKQGDVFADSLGNVHAAALSYNDPGAYVGIDYWSKAVGAGFATPVQVSGGLFAVKTYFPHPVVIANSLDMVAVSWAESYALGPAKIRVSLFDGSNWTVHTLDVDGSFKEWTKTALALNSTTAFCVWRNALGQLSLATFDFSSSGLISPNGGEDWGFAKTYDIKWNFENATGNVDINLFKNDVDLGPIVSDIADSGSYSWTIDTLESGAQIVSGTDYKIEVAARNGSESDISESNFSIQPSIDITAPLAGVNWSLGSTQEITWTKTGTQNDYVNITLFKSSTAVLTIGTSLDNSGSFFWTIPGSITPDADYSIRVETVDGLVLDDSEVFSILGSIEVTSPTAGVEWLYGDTYSITWNVLGTMNANVKLRLRQNDVNIVVITDSTPNNGSYIWTVPSSTPEASNYVIMIKTIDNLVFDTSDEFSIAAEGSTVSLTVTSPVSSSNWNSGSTQTVTWSKTGTQNSNVKIELYKGGALNSTLSSSTLNDGSFSWVIDGAQPSGSDYMVRITTLDDQVTDDSETFSITLVPPEITVTSPAAGANWSRGNSYSINWDTAGSLDNNVKIELIKGGSLNTTISASTQNDGSFSWAIPAGQTAGSDYLVRVTTLDGQVTDDSGVFTISEVLVDGITVTSPSTGQQWIHGNTYTVTWNSVGQLNDYVKIRVYQGDLKIYALSDNTPNDGSFSWTVPITIPSASNYVIRVKTLDNLFYDNSDLFYLGAGAVTPTINITSPASGFDWEAGSTQTISWDKIGTQDEDVKIELFKGGALNSTISASTSNDSSFNWTISSGQTAGSDYTVKVTTLDGQVTDESEVFTISQEQVPTIIVTSPVSSSDWAAGSTQSVSWDKTGTQDADVKIELFKGGALDSTISASTLNDGSFSWVISSRQVAGSDYIVKITTLDGQVTDDSDTFTISALQEDGITITSPTSSSEWVYDNTYTVTWNAVGAMNDRVKLRVYQGDTKIFVLSDDTENDGSFSWTVPSSIPEASDYVIRVKTLDNLVFDNSDLFHIGPQSAEPAITVTAPLSSSTWVTGHTYAVTWDTTGTQDANVKIDLYKNGSMDSSIIASTANSGSYSWTIDGAQTPGTDYFVKVTTLDDQVTDDSDQFEITDTEASLAVTSPDNSSFLDAGTNTNITWSSTGSQNANVNIYLYDNGSFHSNIALTTPNDGSFNWPVNSGINSSSRYSVRVETVDSLVSDDSELFAIFGTGITIALPETGDTLVKGSSFEIQWRAVGSMNSNVKIRLMRNGVKIVGISESTANDGSFVWDIPAGLTNYDDYSIRIKTIDNLVYDDTDLISISDSGITITSPYTNNVLNRGSQYTINWNLAGTMNSNVKIRVFQGEVQILNITDSTANNGSYTWTVPSDLLLATDLVIRVKTIDDLVFDDSGLITIED